MYRRRDHKAPSLHEQRNKYKYQTPHFRKIKARYFPNNDDILLFAAEDQ